MSDVLTTPEIKRALKPASRWRNRWLYERRITHTDGVTFGPGYRILGQFPSQEVAEQRALDYVRRVGAHNVAANGMIYLGAVPADEAP